MFWGCLIYDYKGPCHIYYPETEEQKAFIIVIIIDLTSF
jgi:hypothetical protein